MVSIHVSSAPSVPMTSPTSTGQSQRNALSQQLHSTLMSNSHLNPNSNPTFSSYASSLSANSSSPGSTSSSRPSSPAIHSTQISALTPPQSPTSFPLKSFVGASSSGTSAPSTPPIPTIISVSSAGSPNGSPSSYFPPTAPSIAPSQLLFQPLTRWVFLLTIVASTVALFNSNVPEHCSAPSHVLHSKEYLSLAISPFVVPMSPSLLEGASTNLVSSLLLGFSNLFSLALFEESLTSVFNGHGNRAFRNLFLSMMVVTMILRQFLGFVFSRAVGFQIPALFFSDVMHECNLGLAPYLFSLLVIQSLFSTKVIASVRLHNVFDRSSPLTLRQFGLQLVLCLLNVVPKTIVWWAGSGMIVGFFASMTIHYQRRMGRWGGKVKTSTFENKPWGPSSESRAEYSILEDEDSLDETSGEHGQFRDRRPRNAIWKCMSRVVPTIVFLLCILVGANQIHTYKAPATDDMINSIQPSTPYLMTFVLMTAPRDSGAVYIKDTLSSYLANFPDESSHPLYDRLQIVIYTHFTDFPGFDQARAYFDTIPKARKHVKWVREEGFERNQRAHLVSAIRKVGRSEESVYLAVMEDDFPFCEGGWQTMMNTVYEANQKVEEHCGVFVGTGGSGLIFKRSVALTASFILEADAQHLHTLEADPLNENPRDMVTPPDVALQNCLLGEHDFCSSCAGTLVSSKTLLQRHLGFNSSTSGGEYTRDEFQCGWRQPFNGLPTVHTF